MARVMLVMPGLTQYTKAKLDFDFYKCLRLFSLFKVIKILATHVDINYRQSNIKLAIINTITLTKSNFVISDITNLCTEKQIVKYNHLKLCFYSKQFRQKLPI